MKEEKKEKAKTTKKNTTNAPIISRIQAHEARDNKSKNQKIKSHMHVVKYPFQGTQETIIEVAVYIIVMHTRTQP